MSEEANNALSELKNELKGAINVRLRSPFAGLFALSWLLVNHRMMFVLFSDMKVGKKFDYIDDELYPGIDSWLSMNLLLPLASTVLFLFVSPWVSELITRWNLWHQRRQKDLELRSEGLELLTHKQSRELRRIISAREMAVQEVNRQLLSAQRRVVRLETVAAMSGGLSQEGVLRMQKRYLLMELFMEQITYSSSSQALIKFDEDGYVDVADINAFTSAFAGSERWSFTKDGVVLYSPDREEVGRFVFDPTNEGCFRGSVNGVERLLIGHRP